ncbi:hypothetical protein ETB97_012842 [Aspergillus alliaceus]|uniref:Uncharacterized protein n=1 Tax=Petromyces alliaceus TaxID=209559 RepID=A0A8H6A6K5_PETAA|nr:hypothetical protein ETB97_012842 [Aspergillus burnettii]
MLAGFSHFPPSGYRFFLSLTWDYIPPAAMRTFILLHVAGALLGRAAQNQELNYEESVPALPYGNNAVSVESHGNVWLNIPNFAVHELPHIQKSVGISSLDNARKVQVIARLTQAVASQHR